MNIHNTISGMNKLFITILMLFCAGQIYALPLPQTIQKLSDFCKGNYQLISKKEIPITSAAVTAEPVSACRLIYSWKMPPPENEKEKKNWQDVPEFADIVLIPADSAFRADKAVALSKAVADPAAKDFFFQQYGLEWRKLKSNLKYYTLYAGKNDDFYCFANASLPFLLQLRQVLELTGGFSTPEYLAEALGSGDTDAVTANTAMYMLPAFGNEAIPHVELGLEETAAMDEDTFRFFEVLLRIGTPEALQKINHYAKNAESDYILFPLFDVILGNKVEDIDLLPCYERMLREQVAVKEMTALYQKLKLENELNASCRQIAAEPKNFSNYREAVIVLEKVDDETRKKYENLEEDIRRLLLRGGDMPHSMSYHVVEESEATRNTRLKKEDEKRIKPFIVLLVHSPNPKMAILAALSLCLMDDTNAPYTVKKYVERVRNTGIDILKAMPKHKQLISQTVNTLLTHSTNEREKKILENVAGRIRY